MQCRKILALLVVVNCFYTNSQSQSSATVLTYILRFKELAMEEMQRTGIPAAITLAQGIHETEAGTSDLVKMSNNHFGIKCKDNWNGETVSHDDDAKGECFRKYAAAEDSYRDHSDFLRGRPNYSSLFQLDPTDYSAWAYGLKKAGYATNPRYPQILIKLIEDYHLEDYTLIALGKMHQGDDFASNTRKTNEPGQAISHDEQTTKRILKVSDEDKTSTTVVPTIAVSQDYPDGEFKINKTRVVFIKKGTSYLSIAQAHEIPLARLFEFNDLPQQEIADIDQLIFIQRKRKTGEHEYHVVQPGEDLRGIAQAEAIRLESLLGYNHLSSAMHPAIGETLYLRAESSVTPRLANNMSLQSR